MESYIEDKKNLYALIHAFLEGPEYLNDDDEDTKNEYFSKINKLGDPEEMRQFLKIVKSIGEHHHRYQKFNERTNEILKHYKDQIKSSMKNIEIFRIFENNKKLVHFLLKEDIITISDEIYEEMINKIENNGKRYCHFFIPELEKFASEGKMRFLKNELLKEDPNIFTDYESKREEGENDSYVCWLIRQDSVEEFISYFNLHNYSPLSQIKPSIFETNPFLIDNKNTTLIEYSAFFGSIQIFQYLVMSKVELNPSLWLYAIHSKNAEIIQLLETNRVPPPNNYDQCLIESIKCHHNDIAEYIENNLIDESEEYLRQNEEIISNYIQYHNYSHFQIDAIFDHGFFYLCLYHYDKLFELLMKKKEKIIENKINQYPHIKAAVDKNDVEVIYHYLLKIQEIPEKLFKSSKIKQIAIPSSVISIGYSDFYECSSLTQITIPSSITSIGDNFFNRCSSLTQITIPDSVNSIGNYAFSECSSLTQITIPDSVTSIGESAFCECSTLKQITIPSSVTSIGDSTFSGCSSLTQITIPDSVTSIGDSAFSGCSSLTQITIPNSVTEIKSKTFSNCKMLAQISIPNSLISIKHNSFEESDKLWVYFQNCYSFSIYSTLSNDLFISSSDVNFDLIKEEIADQITHITLSKSVNSIPESAFKNCSSLRCISIPSTIERIGEQAFYGCSSLISFQIPPSIKKIENLTFYGCSSLTEVKLHSSLKKIGEYAFYGCSSIIEVIIPESVSLINDSIFEECSSLKKVIIPESVGEIGKRAFKGCTSLEEIIIPSSVDYIDDEAFESCSSLKKISLPSTIDRTYIGIPSGVQITLI